MAPEISWLCPILGFGFVLIVIAKLIHSLTNRGVNRQTTTLASANLMTAMADDGFWISSNQVNPSALLHYYYWVHGVQQMGQVPFEPGPDGRQFIYTGARPDSVSVVLADSTPAADGSDAGTSPPVITSSQSSWLRPSTRSGPMRHPPAY